MDQVAADSPIVLFDSGVGGLTVLGAMRKLLPQAPVIYAADMAGLPYGAKSEAEVAARVAGLLGRIAEVSKQTAGVLTIIDALFRAF